MKARLALTGSVGPKKVSPCAVGHRIGRGGAAKGRESPGDTAKSTRCQA